MKKMAIASAALLLVTAGSAIAGGVNLSWSDCGAFGAAALTSACSNNAIAGTLYVTAVPPVDMNSANGQSTTIDLVTTAATLSPWWHMETGPTGCAGRTTAFFGNMDFTADLDCADPWAGQAASGVNYATGMPFLPNRARMQCIGAIASTTPITTATEWAICKLVIGGARTTGAGSCAGCLDGACLVLQDVLLTQPMGVGDHRITNPLDRQSVTWQANGGSVPQGCPGATPARSRTWGAVKSIYR